MIKFALPIIIASVLYSCKSNLRDELSNEELRYLYKLGILKASEKIIRFDSQADFETSGNFFTERRIASYWISERTEECDTNSAFFKDIDSLQLTDLVDDFSYASYITVYIEDGTSFRVHVDADSASTYEFYNLAKQNWEEAKEDYEKMCSRQYEFGQFEPYQTKHIPSEIFDEPVALLFFENMEAIGKYDNGILNDSLPEHLKNDGRQRIYKNHDITGLYHSYIKPTLNQYEIPKIQAYIADSSYGFMVDDKIFLIDTKVMLKMDGVIFYQPGKLPQYWTLGRGCTTCEWDEGIECYYNL